MTKPTKRSKTELSPTQNAIVQLRDVQGLTFEAIAQQIDMNRSNVHRAYTQAKAKLAKQEQARRAGLGIGQDETDLRARGDPLVAINEVREAARAYMPKVGDKELTESLDNFLGQTSYFLVNSTEKMAAASLKDLMAVHKSGVEVRQLLRGEPTQIVSIKEIRSLDEQAKALYAEMARRGLMVDVTPTEVAEDGNADV